MSKPILLVEDNPDDELLALYALKKNGLGGEEVAVARDGAEALEYLLSAHDGREADGLPGLVLLDQRLPEVDGPEVLRRLRADDRTASLPVVVLTAGDLLETPADHGACTLLRKPLTSKKLAEAARKLGVKGLLPGEAAQQEKQAIISGPSRAVSRGARPLRVLLVEDSEDDAALILRALRRGGNEPICRRVESRARMEVALAEEKWDALVSDYHLLAFGAIEALQVFKESGLDLPFIVVSGKIGEDVAVEIMRAGAHDYITKANLARLGPAVEREVREARGRRERRRAEAALRESEHRFRSLVQNSSDITLVLDARGTILYESPPVERMLGYTPEERVGRNIFDLVHPGDVERLSDALVRSLEGPDFNPPVEYRARHKDGSWRHFEAVVNNLLSDPIIKGIVVNSRDITDRKRTEEELEESKDRHRAVVEQAAENIFLVDLDTKRILEANAALRTSLSYTDGELQQITLYDIVAHDRESIDLNIRRLVEEGPSFLGQRSYRRKDGSLLDVEVSVSVISYSGKEAMCIVAHDVTERKRAEGELRRQMDLYEGVLTAQSEVGEGFLITEGSRIRFVNEAFCEISGYGREELLAMPSFFEFFPPEERPVFSERFMRRMSGEGSEDHQEIAILRKDGRRAELEIAVKMLQEEGRARFIIIARDITERKLAEQRRNVQYAVSRVLAESVGLEEAAPKLLETIGATLGWKLGLLWMVDRSASVLRCKEVWHAPNVVAVELEAASRETNYTQGRGLPGRVWKSGEPLWIPDVLKDATFLLPKSAAREGLHGFFAFPIQDEGRVLGVIEFFSRGILPPDEGLLQTVTTLGNQIGQFIERKRKEQALWESEERFRDIFEQAAVGVALVGIDGRWLRVNQKLCDIVGYSWEELTGMTFQDITHPDDLDTNLEHLSQLLAGKIDTYCMEKRYIKKDGSITWIGLTVSSGCGPSGAPEYLISIIEDITERKRAEEALRRSEARRFAVVDTAFDSIVTMTLDGNIESFNQGAESTFGYTAEEAIGKPLTLLMPDRFQEAHVAGLRSYLRTGVARFTRQRRIELTGRRKNGEEFPLELSLAEVCESGDTLFSAIIRDISERKISEEALKESEERFRSLVQNASDVIIILEADGIMRYESPAIERVMGYRPEELVGKNVFGYVHPADLEYLSDALGEEVGNSRDGQRNIEFRFRHADGSWRQLEAVVNNLLEEPSVAGIVINSRDITERKQTEESLRHNLGMLLALYEASQIVTSTVNMEERGARLLMIMHRVADLSAAIISLRDERGQSRVWKAIGAEHVWSPVHNSPEAWASRHSALEAGGTQVFRPRGSDPEAPPVGLCLPLRAGGKAIGILEAFGSEALTEKRTLDVLSSLASLAGSALENARLYEELAEREYRLEDLVGKLMTAQEEERRRVAYEVHDSLAQVAAAAHQHLQAFARFYPPDSEESREILYQALDLVQQTVRDARRIIANLRPTALDDFGLQAAVRLEVEALREEDWRISFEGTLRDDERLPFAVETALFRIVQEALTNIRKHANTKQVRLSLDRLEQGVHLSVQDWGEGFDPATRSNSGGPGERIGLSSMRERAALLGGDFEIRSQPGAGTLITVYVPLLKQREADRERDDTG